MDRGFIKLDRKLLEWRWITQPNTLAVWIWLLLNANWEDKDFLNITIKRGSLATSYAKIGDAVGITPRQSRTALEHLKETKEVSITRHSKFLEITINNYDRYQQRVTEKSIKSQSKVNQMSTTKELKKGRNKEYIYARARGSMSNIFLTEDQEQMLKAEFPNDGERLVNELSEYKAKMGKEYEDDYAALLTFARRQGLTPQSELPDYRIETEVELDTDKDGYEVARTIRYRVYPDGRREIAADGT
jgi:hypothetical protein